MLKNYIRLAVRNLWKNKIVSGTNILGLTIGISCSLMLLLYVKYEYSYDSFLSDLDRTYFQVLDQNGPNPRTVGLSIGPDFQDLKSNYSGVEDLIKIRNNSMSISLKDAENKVGINSWFSSDNFFDFFGYELIAGDASEVLSDPSSIVLTQSVATQLFGEENPIGKIVTIHSSDFTKDLAVSGISKDVGNTHINFEAIIPWEMTLSDGRNIPQMYFQNSLYTYVKLTEGYNIDQLKESRNDWLNEIQPDNNGAMSFDYVALKDMYLGTSHVQFLSFESGNRNTVVTLFAIALIILLVACINYINLQTAKGSRRSLEVGVRKVMGAHRRQLVFQFLGESFIVTFISAVFAILVLDLSLPAFNELTGKDFDIQALQSVGLFPFLIAIALITAFFSGIYPALVLSSFKPSRVLKMSKGGGVKDGKARRVLILMQFVISLFLIAVTVLAYKQTQFINNKELGFNKDQVITFQVNSKNLRTNARSFQAELDKNPGVLSSSLSTDVLGLGYTNNSGPIFMKSNPDMNIRTTLFGVDHDFLETYEIELVKGRDFDLKISSDSSGLIVNETFANQMKVEDPLSEKVALYSPQNTELPIIGIVKDFHFQKLHQEITPVAMRIAPRNVWNLSVRMDQDRIAETLSFIEGKWNEFESEQAFTYSFVDQKFQKFYESEMSLLKAITIFSIISIVLTALGLFGTVTFVIERKTKEIGIRKVLGASLNHINLLIFKEFFILLMVALVITTPLAIFASSDWLDQFAYSIEQNAIPIIAAFTLTLFVVLATVGMQSIKTARQNPIKSLRDE